MTRMRYLMLAFLTGSLSCTSTPKEEHSNKELNITESTVVQKMAVPAKLQTGLAPYQFQNEQQKVEWISCQVTKAKNAVLVMNRDEKGFDNKKFCQGWIAQVFIRAGYDVVTLNRPGFPNSTGYDDFSGPQTNEAIKVALAAMKKEIPGFKPIIGIWGSSIGVIAAVSAAKDLEGLKWLVLGAGIYDLDDTLQSSKDSALVEEIKKISKLSGSEGLEKRSLNYDVVKLPKKIIIYHGELDSSVPPSQVQSYRDTLASSQYDVTLQMLSGISHEIPWEHHRQILEIILLSLSKD